VTAQRNTSGPAIRSAGPHHHRAGAVTEQERRTPVGRVDDVGHPLDADDHDVPGGSAAHRVRRDGQGVAEAGAAGTGVHRAGAVRPDPERDLGGQRRRLPQVAHRGDQHQRHLVRSQARLTERLARRGGRHVRQAFPGTGDVSGADPGPREDPLVTGVDRSGDVVVAQRAGGSVGTETEDRRGRGRSHH
jgi:hypothetical protein